MPLPRKVLIIGCGLAGSAVAWAAHRRGWVITLVDKPNPDSCSRVAAGLVTPITGSRAAASWRWEEFFQFATHHYLDCESATGQQFWKVKPALRIFQSEAERQRSIERWCSSEQCNQTDSDADSEAAQPSRISPQMKLCETSEIAGYSAPFGAAWMSPAARLDTQRYLDATLIAMSGSHRVIEQDIALNEESFTLQRNRLHVRAIDEEFDNVFLCQGFAGRFNPWFSDLPLHPARGDILTVKLDSEFERDHVVHASSWLVPLCDSLFLTGATYDRQTLDGIVDERAAVVAARQEALQRVDDYLVQGNLAIEDDGGGTTKVIAHRAAVRPASYDRHPLIGRHATLAQLYVLNGLGSKGTLMAPRLADMLLESIDSNASIDPQLLWTRTPKRSANTEC